VEKPLPEEKPPVEERISPLDHIPVGRVLILDARQSVRIRTRSAFFIGGKQNEAPLKRIEEGGDFTVRHSGDRVKLVKGSAALLEAPLLSIRSASGANIYVNGKPFRGGFVFRSTQGGIITINVLEVDDYIKGVLPSEIGYLERSYALSKLEE
jgi:hypothetical protein